jgi:hypothetical protein
MITVVNNSDSDIQVAISNQWTFLGGASDSKFCDLAPGKQETWNRTRLFGYLMILRSADDENSKLNIYYVLGDMQVNIKNESGSICPMSGNEQLPRVN